MISGALRAACEEMGAVLVRAAHSANIKERRDCSCALFDADGQMVMQAEHIPVHLGAMPAAVRAVADAREPGDDRPWIVNDPYAGGYVTRHYGRPRDRVHVIQLEIARSLYMDERSIARLNQWLAEKQAPPPEIGDGS